jgi:hypothetical protein
VEAEEGEGKGKADMEVLSQSFQGRGIQQPPQELSNQFLA